MGHLSRSTGSIASWGITAGAVIAAMAALVAFGCGGGGSLFNRGGSATVSTQGAIEGYAFVPSGGGASTRDWAFSPGSGAARSRQIGGVGSQSSVTLLNTPATPTGFSPLSGATVTLIGLPQSVTTGPDGHFLLAGVAAGHQQIQISNSAGVSATVLVTVMGGATVQVGTTAISRQQAISAVQLAVGSPIAPEGTMIIGPQQPLPAGVIVAPAMESDPSLQYHVPTPQWFFYVDPQTSAMLEHPVSYYFVDAQSGQVTVQKESSWPTLNGLSFYASSPDEATVNPDLAQAPISTSSRMRTVPPSPALPAGPNGRQSSSCSGGQTYVLVVEGYGGRRDFTADNTNMNNFATNVLKATGRMESHSPSNSSPSGAVMDIQAKYQTLCAKMHSCDTFLLLVSSHGNPNGTTGLEQTPSSDGSVPDVVKADLSSVIDIKACPACTFIAVISTCYSGKLVQNWGQKIVQQKDYNPGQHIALFAGTEVDELGFSEWDKSKPQGTYFMTDMINALTNQITPSQPGLGIDQAQSAYNSARPSTMSKSADEYSNTDVSPARMGDHPTFFSFWDGSPCGGPATTGTTLGPFMPVTGQTNGVNGTITATTSWTALYGTPVTGVTSSGATSSGATSSGATTSGATTSGATTSGATTSGATTSGATTSGATTSGVSTSGATTAGATTAGATTAGATTAGATTAGATTSGTTTGATSTTTTGNAAALINSDLNLYVNGGTLTGDRLVSSLAIFLITQDSISPATFELSPMFAYPGLNQSGSLMSQNNAGPSDPAPIVTLSGTSTLQGTVASSANSFAGATVNLQFAANVVNGNGTAAITGTYTLAGGAPCTVNQTYDFSINGSVHSDHVVESVLQNGNNELVAADTTYSFDVSQNPTTTVQSGTRTIHDPGNLSNFVRFSENRSVQSVTGTTTDHSVITDQAGLTMDLTLPADGSEFHQAGPVTFNGATIGSLDVDYTQGSANPTFTPASRSPHRET